MHLQAVNKVDYDEFVEKFKPKKTTDDCYTPELIYSTVSDWVLKEYGISENTRIIRPFYPGKDYQTEDYSGDCVVIDNPPFSIISQIYRWYNEHGVRYFLFAPGTSLFNSQKCNYVICGVSVTYENGAKVSTSFITNMGDARVYVCPELTEALEQADVRQRKSQTKKVPKYDYPAEVISAAGLAKLAKHGVSLKIAAKDMFFVRALDSQRSSGKAIFGAGYLLSEKAAAEKAAAEKAAAEKAAAERANAIIWPLSERERKIIKTLG